MVMSAFALAYSYEPGPEPKPEPQNKAAARVSELLDRVDYRLIESDEDRAAIGRLRYEAYLREGAIDSDPSKSFTDPHDDDKNAWTFGVYIDEELAASVRMHVATKDCPVLPSLEVFPDLLEPELEAGKTIIDPTRLVTDQRLARLYPNLPYVTVRTCWMATIHFKAELTLAAVRPEHQAFYTRTFNYRPICGPRSYPLLSKPITLMTADYRKVSDYVYRRFPFYRSTYFERRMLFERHAPLVPATMAVSPLTAEQPLLLARKVG
jgi:hypothetical protein